jgi:formylglycine-generating enzyme
MSRIIFVSALLVGLLYDCEAWGVTIDWSPVTNPGNAADPREGDSLRPGLHFGAVAYSFNIGTYDVTTSQYAEFLDAKDPTGANVLGLYNTNMSNAVFGGITYTPSNPAGAKYSAMAGRENHPITNETWYSAVRFANWINNGQGNADTESGAYTLLGGTPTPSNALTIVRSSDATVWLPSEDEWYKAAYYHPVGNYYSYPTGSDISPTASAPTALPNSANIANAVGNYTDVGAYSGTTSYYGAYDMAGNVLQWNESLIANEFRGLRGATFAQPAFDLLPNNRSFSNADDFVSVTNGFRLASVPEPSAIVLAALAGVTLLAIRSRGAYRRQRFAQGRCR